MRDAARLARACNQAGVSEQQFYLACCLLACVDIDAALAFVAEQQKRGLTGAPYQPALFPEDAPAGVQPPNAAEST